MIKVKRYLIVYINFKRIIRFICEVKKEKNMYLKSESDEGVYDCD